MPREVRQIEMWSDVRQFNAVGIDALVSAGAGSLKRKCQLGMLAADRRPANLYVAEEHHPIGSPVLQLVREHVNVHKGAPSLTDEQGSYFAISVPEPKSCLACVNPSAEQLKFERRFQIAQGRSRRRLHAEP